MKFDVLTLFPEMFEPIKSSIIGRATKSNILEINLVNIRDFSEDKHGHVDDTPYGGGAGMLIKPDVVYRAYNSIEKTDNTKVIYLTPQGNKLTQSKVEGLAKFNHLVLLCGHYEGIDDRVIQKIAPEEISIGDYVLTGGELPSMVLIDSVSRYVAGVLNKDSTYQESFEGDGLLEYPQYTKPEEFEGMKVPEVLLSGHHANIEKWRRKKAIENTYKKRPELLENAKLTREDKNYLEELKFKNN
jgi:tRNA (guanine37-N1)-methyltransferase